MAYTFNPFSGNFDNAPFVPQIAGVYFPLSGGIITGNLQVSGTTTLSEGLEVGGQGTVALFVGTDKVGVNTESPNEALTVSGNISASGIVYGQIPQLGNYLPLSGGVVTGAVRFNDNVTIFGNLSCTGTQTFANTVFTTTSAVSVVHFGSGPAMWVGNNGDGDIASFYDIDAGVEILHVGGNTGDFPNVGVKTSTPNKDFTVNGEISARSTIYDGQGNSDQWNSVYSTVQSNSAINWNYQGTDLKDLSANWQNTFNTVEANSAVSWDNTLANQYARTNFLPLSGGTLTDKLTLLSSTTAVAPFKIPHGSDPLPAATALSAAGDIWLNGSIRYRDQIGTIRFVADLNRPNIWTQNQTILTGTTTTAAALRITQEGSGNALIVEDSSNPDATPFVVDSLGSVGIGLSSLSGIDAKLTIIGNVSSTSILYASGGNSNNWNSVYSTVQSNSAVNWNYQGTDLKNLSANWESTYTVVQQGSSNWYEASASAVSFANNKFLPLSGGSVNGNLTVSGNVSATSVVYDSGGNSNNWNSVYSIVQAKSATNWDNSLSNQYADSKFLPLSGGNVTGDLTVNGNLTVQGTTTQIDTYVAVTSAAYINTNSNETALRITQTGSGDILRVEDSPNPDSTPFIINSDGRVGVGTPTPNELLTVVGNVSATGNITSGNSRVIVGSSSDTTPVYSIRMLTQAQYNAISVPDANTLYIITA